MTRATTDPVGDDRAGRERRAPSRTTVLVVEDDGALLELARVQLEAQSFQVAVAESAEAGIEEYLAAAPDLVLLDLALPDRSGFDVCETIRSLPGGESVPIVIMTGMGDAATISRAYRSGASDFAVKPPNWTVLGNRIQLLIEASRTRQHLASSRSKLERAESTAQLGTWEYDLIEEKLTASEETWRILGSTPEGSTELDALLDSVHPLDKTSAVATFERMASELAEIDLEHRIIWPDGSVRTVTQRAQVRRNQAGHAVSVQGVLQDVTDLRRAQERIRHLANYDRLTGLPNRHMFVEFLEGCIARTQRRGSIAAVVHIDIDRFKKINETLGPEVGDQVLVSIADRLRISLRKGDFLVREDGPAVARWGGDRFLVLLSGIGEIADAARAVQRLLRQLAIPFAVPNRECFLTAGAGIAVYPSDGESAYELLQHAESASYHAKQLGRSRLQFYSQWMNESSARNLDLENELHKALLQHQFHLAYQPILDVRSSQIAGAEALLRWSHPELGAVSPGEFIPIAESAGLMPSIGEWVLRAACRQLRSWLDDGMAAIRLSVNLSSLQLLEDGFVDLVGRILEDAQLDPRLLEVELTERGLNLEDEGSIEVVEALRALGLRVAVDDFGVGNSALSYLRSFPLDTLKIDKSFIGGIRDGSSDSAIVSAVIMMAHRLNLEVVAEGVEEREQFDFLASQACDRAQGFLFAKPLAPAQFAEAFDTIGGLPQDCPPSKRIQ